MRVPLSYAAASTLIAGLSFARAAPPAPPGPSVSPTGELSWSLPRDEPDLPAGPGREAFYSACATCHSTRYVTDQPRFPRETWRAEVEKMKKSYGAEVPEGGTDVIADYLVGIHGSP